MKEARDKGSFNVGENVWHDLAFAVGTANYHIQYSERNKDQYESGSGLIGFGIAAVLLVLAAVGLVWYKLS